jgi:uroporphyrinogen decarboxylase
MNSYERVMACLAHEPADRLPVDGSFHNEVWRALEAHFETADHEAILEALGIDLRPVGMGSSDAFRARATHTRHGWRIVHPDGTLEDEWGVHVRYDRQGRYYRFAHQPLAETPLEEYTFPDLDAPGRFPPPAPGPRSPYARVAGISNLFKGCWHLRGLDRWMMDLLVNVDYAEALLDRMLAWSLALVRRLAGQRVDILGLIGDISMQQGMMISPTVWRALFKQREAQLVAEARRLGIPHVYFHSDGNPSAILDDLVEIGIDMVDPVQPECVDPAALRRRYGNRLTLHGTISSQHTLPFGSPGDVRTEVEERIRTCGASGGLIIAPNNVVQPDVPLENLLTMYATVQDVGARAYRST